MGMKNITLLALAIFLLVSCSEKKQTISGEIENLGEAEIILNKYTTKGIVEVAKTKAAEGKFSFEYSPEEPEMHFVKTEKFNVPLFLDNSSVTITGDVESPADIVVEGSASDEEYKAFEKIMIPLSEDQMSLRKQYRDYSQRGDQENMKAIYTEYETLQNKTIQTIKDHITDYNDTYLSAFLADVYFTNTDDFEELKAIFTTLDNSLDGYSHYDNIKNKYNAVAAVAIGSEAPDFTLNDPDGNPISLSSFKGKYVLVDFWASWCGPCRQENPNIVAVYKRYGGDKFEILGVSLDQTKDNWLKGIEDDKLVWPQVSDLKYWQSDAAKLYGVKVIPHNVLIDPDGIIIAKDLLGNQLEEKLKTVLN